MGRNNFQLEPRKISIQTKALNATVDV